MKRSEHQFKVGDIVYVDSSHFRIQSGTNKLNPINLGPFEIIKSNGKNSFSLKLPSNMRVHNSFHVSKLKLSNQNDNNKFPLRELQPPPDPIINEDGESEYEIEKIVDHRKKRNRMEYRVRWKGFDSTEDTWETTNTLSKERDSINDYLDSLNEQQINYVHTINNKCNRKSPCTNRTRRSEYCQPRLNKFKNRITISNVKVADLGLFAGKKGFVPYTGTQSKQPLVKLKYD